MIMLNQETTKYVDLILEEPYKIGHWVGFNDLTSLHNEWGKESVASLQRNEGIVEYFQYN